MDGVDHLQVWMKLRAAGRRHEIPGDQRIGRGGVCGAHRIHPAKETARCSQRIGHLAGRHLVEGKTVIVRDDGDGRIVVIWKKIGKDDGLAPLQPAFGDQFGLEARRYLMHALGTEGAGLAGGRYRLGQIDRRGPVEAEMADARGVAGQWIETHLARQLGPRVPIARIEIDANFALGLEVYSLRAAVNHRPLLPVMRPDSEASLARQ
jgi:hypothetical protein